MWKVSVNNTENGSTIYRRIENPSPALLSRFSGRSLLTTKLPQTARLVTGLSRVPKLQLTFIDHPTLDRSFSIGSRCRPDPRIVIVLLITNFTQGCVALHWSAWLFAQNHRTLHTCGPRGHCLTLLTVNNMKNGSKICRRTGKTESIFSLLYPGWSPFFERLLKFHAFLMVNTHDKKRFRKWKTFKSDLRT